MSAYQPLARKYRPKTFLELVGQEPLAQALTNSIRLKRAPAGVIFSGIRGVGKTTTARLYAKALNCEGGPTPEPCGVCGSCRAIEFGTHEDVVEIDGASNNGVDEIRALREAIAYIPQRSSYKVYIIDEVHMLSISAFNALLKTLEEPPKHVVFVLATTELQKIPATIVGRCQTFYLSKIPQSVTEARLASIMKQEGLAYEEGALGLVAKEGHGSLRDALTFLDQAVAIGGGKVTKALLLRLTGTADFELYCQLLSALTERDGNRCLSILDQIDGQGVSFERLVSEVLSLVRHGFVLRDVKDEKLLLKLLPLEDHVREALKTIATRASAFDLNRIFRTFVKCKEDLNGSGIDRYIVENYCLEWCLDPGLPSEVSFVGSDPAIAKPQPPLPEAREGSAVSSPVVAQADQIPVVAEESGFPSTWRGLIDRWRKERPLQARKLEETRAIAFGPNEILLAISKDSMAAGLLNPEVPRKLQEEFKKLFGFEGVLRVVEAMESHAESESLLEVRAREQQESASRKLQAAVQHPLTQGLLKEFGGTIVQ